MKMRKIIPMMMVCALPVSAIAQSASGLVSKNLDKKVRPQDNFYQFANGGWQKNNPLPAA